MHVLSSCCAPRACFCHAFAFRLVIIAEQASLSHLAHCPPVCHNGHSPSSVGHSSTLLFVFAKRLPSQSPLPLDPGYHRNSAPYVLSNSHSAGCERCLLRCSPRAWLVFLGVCVVRWCGFFFTLAFKRGPPAG